MELRALGQSDLRVSVLSFGTATFGGTSEIARLLAGLGAQEAARLVGMCCDAGVNMFDTADIYSDGEAEILLGAALRSRRNQVLISTKAFGRTGPGPDDVGSSRSHLRSACEASLKRLGTDRIDLYQLHGFDAMTPLEETVLALDELVREGKVRHVGCSNFAAWQLVKALGIAERTGSARWASQQIYYSLVGRDAEHELIPAGLDQDLGTLVWGPLASGLLSGKVKRGEIFPADTRIGSGVPGATDLFDPQRAFDVLDVAREIAADRGVPMCQVALNWLLRRSGVTTVLIGARNERQLEENLNALQWQLTLNEIERLDASGSPRLPYPLWHQQSVYQSERNPALEKVRRGN